MSKRINWLLKLTKDVGDKQTITSTEFFSLYVDIFSVRQFVPLLDLDSVKKIHFSIKFQIGLQITSHHCLQFSLIVTVIIIYFFLMMFPSSTWIFFACAPYVFSCPIWIKHTCFSSSWCEMVVRLNYALPSVSTFSWTQKQDRNNKAMKQSHLQNSSFKSLLWDDEAVSFLLVTA